jgi:hypothetical protein
MVGMTTRAGAMESFGIPSTPARLSSRTPGHRAPSSFKTSSA